MAAILDARHYLGAATRGFALEDEFGIMVFANPNSRRLPQHRWIELTRWCLFGEKNAGSRQWKRATAWVRTNMPTVTTVISYSDPSVGHTGSLYRACNWIWAPTWHRLRTPPSGNGSWDGGVTQQAAKDRWAFPLQVDIERTAILAVNDVACVRKFPDAEYREPRKFMKPRKL